MGKKQKYRYTFEAQKQYKSYSSVSKVETFELSIIREEFDTQRARYDAKKLLEKDNGCTSYSTDVELLKVEEI